MKWSGASLRRPDATLWCWDSGGTGPVVLLLHGLAGYAGEWHATAEALARDFRVLAFDQRGHGASTRRPRDLSRVAFVDDVVAVADELVGGPVTLVGQSMGAHTAMLTAARHPDVVERLVMAEGGVGGGGSAVVRRVAEYLASWPVPFPTRADALHYFGGDTPAGRAWATGLEARSDGLRPCFDVDVMAASLAFVEDRDFWDEWASIAQPTLLVLAQTGSIPPDEVARMASLRSGTKVAVVAGAGHDVHLEQTHAWLDILQGFLSE